MRLLCSLLCVGGNKTAASVPLPRRMRPQKFGFSFSLKKGKWKHLCGRLQRFTGAAGWAV
jgi:hypothetical protein